MADYQVILNATGWYEKNVLKEEYLAGIDAKISAQYENTAEEYEAEVQITQ